MGVDANTPHEKAINDGKNTFPQPEEGGQKMTQEECQFCHIQEAPPFVEKAIEQMGLLDSKDGGLRSLVLPFISRSYYIIVE